jgi:hypothetical protein
LGAEFRVRSRAAVLWAQGDKGTTLVSNDSNGAADELARWAENLERKAQQYQQL